MNAIEKFRTLGLSIIGTLILQVAFSQETYMPGFVIKNSSDTLFGFIDYRNWEKNPNKIAFKQKNESDRILYTPTEIAQFGVNGEIYISAIVDTEVSNQTNNLEETAQLNIKVDTAFLQTLIEGKKSLYYLNSDGRHNFYIRQGQELELLQYKKWIRQETSGSSRAITENKKYLGQLAAYLSDCKSMNAKLKNTGYGQKALVKLFQYYYKCSQSDISFQREIAKLKMEIGALGGVSVTSLDFTSSSPTDYLANTEYNKSTNFSTGLFFDLILPRNHGKWSLNSELLYTSYQVSGSYEEFTNENYYTITSTEIGYSYLNLNTLVRYKYPIGKIFVYLNAGMSNGFAINEINSKVVESKFYSQEAITEGQAIDGRKYEQGWIIGTGVKYNKLSFEVRYEKGNGMSQYTHLGSITKAVQFLVGYRF